jgi:hypothetical protein
MKTTQELFKRWYHGGGYFDFTALVDHLASKGGRYVFDCGMGEMICGNGLAVRRHMRRPTRRSKE